MYAACDLLIGRGGASTVHEVAVTGAPAILVPWAGAADDHQTDNVEWLSEVGAAVLMPEGDTRPDSPSRSTRSAPTPTGAPRCHASPHSGAARSTDRAHWPD